MNALQNNIQSEQSETRADGANAPNPAESIDHLSYEELGKLLADGVHSQNGHIHSRLLLQNLWTLSYQTSSPEIITSLWLQASKILRDGFRKMPTFHHHAKLFKEFWQNHQYIIKDFLSEAPLPFLSGHSKYLLSPIFHSNECTRILLRRLDDLENTTTSQSANDILRVYRGLHLMPPAQFITGITIDPIHSGGQLIDFTSLLHSLSRAGLSIAQTNLIDIIADIKWNRMIKKIDMHEKNSLLWSLTSQFAFAHDGGTAISNTTTESYLTLLDTLRKYAQNDRHLRRTFNMAAIMFDKPMVKTGYKAKDRSSDSEYNFMHDFREYVLTPDERANLKTPDIAKHIAMLDRELDGHYMIGDQPVIIEFDGPSHYRRSLDNHGDEPNGSTKLQTHILQKLFPDHVIIRLHHKLGNSFTSLPENEKPDTFAKFRGLISQRTPDAYYIDLHNGQLRTQTARELQQRHNNEYGIGITRQPTQM